MNDAEQEESLLTDYHIDWSTTRMSRSQIRLTDRKEMLDEFALCSVERDKRWDQWLGQCVCRTLHAHVTGVACWLPDSSLNDDHTNKMVYLHTALSFWVAGLEVEKH